MSERLHFQSKPQAIAGKSLDYNYLLAHNHHLYTRFSIPRLHKSNNKMLSFAITASNMFTGKKQNKLPVITEHLLLQPAHELSKQIKDGSLTSVKLCELFMERIKQVNPFIRAMTQDRFKGALEQARQIDQLLDSFRSGKSEADFSPHELEMLHSPLLGVPITVKESIAVNGMKNTCGIWARRDFVAGDDAVVVRNVQRFGMIPICTSNVPECTLYWADCQNVIYGRSMNPYDLSRITGASSGGEGALLGSGGSVIGIGSDIGGSLRIPAHCCGVYSHKPSPFLLSPEGNFPAVHEHRMRLFTLGPMVRYASDLKPLLKCLMSDKDNSKRDTYYKYQPENIASLRETVLQKLDEPVDLNQLKIFYCDFNSDSKLKGANAISVQPEFMEAQNEILDHFRSKFNCQVQQIKMDDFLQKGLIVWQCMLTGAALEDGYNPDELKKMFGINNMPLEFFKIPLGLSKHTKESLLAMMMGGTLPKGKAGVSSLCEKFEKLAAEQKAELESKLGDKGVLIMPTLPKVAYKHDAALFKSQDLRFPALFNSLQLPVSHATIRLDKKNQLPFGFSIAGRPYNDALTLAVAEEIELAFGGWVQPTSIPKSSAKSNKLSEKQSVGNKVEHIGGGNNNTSSEVQA